jgi:hypothetical protein
LVEERQRVVDDAAREADARNASGSLPIPPDADEVESDIGGRQRHQLVKMLFERDTPFCFVAVADRHLEEVRF